MLFFIIKNRTEWKKTAKFVSSAAKTCVHIVLMTTVVIWDVAFIIMISELQGSQARDSPIMFMRPAVLSKN